LETKTSGLLRYLASGHQQQLHTSFNKINPHSKRNIWKSYLETQGKKKCLQGLTIAISNASLVTTFALERLRKFQKATHVFNLNDSSSLRMLGLFDFRKSLNQGRCVRV